MAQTWPEATENVVIGLDDAFNFMNYADPSNPQTLRLTVKERSTIIFSFTEKLLNAGWSFQDPPFVVRNDYGVNFSSYTWVDNTFESEPAPDTKYKVVFECDRLGEYEYSIKMQDRHGQKITLDPKISNGAGY